MKNKYKLVLYLGLLIISIILLIKPVYAYQMQVSSNSKINTDLPVKQNIDLSQISINQEKANVTNSSEYNQSLSEIYKKKKKDATSKETPKPPSLSKIFFSLTIVILLIYVVAWIYSKIKGVNPNMVLTGKLHQKNWDTFNILSTASLGQGKNIHLIEINEKKIVIGSTLNNINLLTELSPVPQELHRNENAQTDKIAEEENVNKYNQALNCYRELYKDYLTKE